LPNARWLLACAFVTACCFGCAEKSTNRYIPSADAARKALEAGLQAWQDGQPVGMVKNTSPQVQVVDSQWQAGQKLRAYQIVQEEDREGRKWFSVRLTLKNAPGEKTVRYVVVGREPIMVFREDDYSLPKGM